jgi:hypothetical protein
MNRRAAKFLIVGGILAFGVLGGLFVGHSPSEEPDIDNASSDVLVKEKGQWKIALSF